MMPKEWWAEVRELLRDPVPLWHEFRHWFREARRPVERRNRLDDDAVRHLLAFTLGPDANCVDVGAHSGGVLAEMVRCAPDGSHVAFEPLPDLARALRLRFPEVEVQAAAVGAHAGTATFIHVLDTPALSGLRDRTDGRLSEQTVVPVVTLDGALADDYVPTLIKIDVEGAELDVLRGAMAVLKRHRPIVVFEHGLGGAPLYGTRPDDIYDLLVDEVGLRIFDLDGAGPYSRQRFSDEAFAECGGHWNWVARV